MLRVFADDLTLLFGLFPTRTFHDEILHGIDYQAIYLEEDSVVGQLS